ncbi:S49 family peptidase [Bradyrhizobium sp. 33ap4]|uniref:S49 family peptidase n=1 Tax=Bradyrhizobium sp. 33ap4 TaxID=3061630 RepID=UPI003977D5C9
MTRTSPASPSTSTVQAERSRQRSRPQLRSPRRRQRNLSSRSRIRLRPRRRIGFASQAGELVITPSADVGSIGAIIMHQDISGWLDRVGIKMTIVRSENRRIKTRRIRLRYCRTRLEPIRKTGQTRLAPISSRRSRAAVASQRPRSARSSSGPHGSA